MSQYSRLKKKETVETTSNDGKTKVVKVKEHFSNGVTALQKTIAIIGGSLGICTALITLNNYRNSQNDTSTDSSSQTTSVFNWGWGNNDSDTREEVTTDGATNVVDTTDNNASYVDNTTTSVAPTTDENLHQGVANDQVTTEEVTAIETPTVEGTTE